MTLLTSSSSSRAAVPATTTFVSHKSGTRGGGRHRLGRLLTLATVGALLVALLVHAQDGGVVTARAAFTPTKDSADHHGSGEAIGGPRYIFASVEELNQYSYSAPYIFHQAGYTSQAPDGGTDADNAQRDSTTAASSADEARELAEALELHAASGVLSHAEATSPLRGGASTSSLSSFPQHSSSAEVNVSAASMCAADWTCPRSSVAWASGAFTAAGLLTPHSLTLPVGLSLRLSLCCQYRFDGTLLRSQELYDAFLQELLQASPFQVLSAAEKRVLFPQHTIYIVDTWGRKRVYNTSYELTEEDVATHNDGDGDVLVLTTGVLTSTALQKVLSASPSLAGGSRIGSGESARENADGESNGDSALKEQRRTLVEAVGALPSTDVQLRITNRVLKCKCPHILTVMPLLHVRRDTLPPISIAGLGSHCGVQPTQNVSKAARGAAATHRIRQVRREDGTVGFAASFELMQRLPPTTLISWTVRQAERTEISSASSTSAVLRHTRLIPLIVDAAGSARGSTAASPYFLVEPNVRYEVSITVSRGPLRSATYAAMQLGGDDASAAVAGGTDSGFQRTKGRDTHSSTAPSLFESSLDVQHLRISRSARGQFVLRLPLNRSWALPPVHPAPHFGFRRRMRLTNATLSHPEVSEALDPRWTAPLPSSPSSPTEGTAAAAAEALGGETGRSGGGWFRLGRWSGNSGSGAVPPRHRTLSYYGYWENAPLHDQLQPQQSMHVSSNPYTDPSPAGVSMPLSVGRNLVAYVVRDVDDVCDPVVLEGHEVWAVQSLLQPSGPITACREETEVSALVLRELYLRMRSEPKIDVTVPNTTWAVDRARPAEVGAEGFYRCGAAASDGVPAESSPTCLAVAQEGKDGSGGFASLHMRQRGVYAVVWTVRVAVRDAGLVAAENLDPLYATVVAGSLNSTYLVEVRSRPLLVVRRQASYPAVVRIELPMHARRWLVAPPRALHSPLSSSSSVVSPHTSPGGSTLKQAPDVLSDNAPAGYWRTRLPLRVLAVDERRTAELDTNDVPNVQRVLPNRTLEFVAQDGGEVMSLSAMIDGALRVFPFTSRCPDTVVEYELHVVAFPPPPVVPAYAPIYTEEGCVVLVPPRAVRKDEVAEWRVPPCAAAANTRDGRPPYLVERTVTAEELADHAYVTTTGEGGEAFALSSGSHPASMTSRNSTALSTPAGAAAAAAGVPTRSVTALMACGVEVYQRCDVVWSVRNLVAEVQKTYSLRRCQRPPEVLFHQDKDQREVSFPERGVFELPTVIETVYRQVNATVAGADGAAWRRLSSGAEPQRRRRQVIPIAGYHSTLGYSFNYTGVQNHFEMHLHPVPNAVAHQLDNTQHDFVEAEDGVMVLRRRTSVEMQQQQQQSQFGEKTHAHGSQDDTEAFWAAYEASSSSSRTQNGEPTSTTATAADADAHARRERLHAQQRSRELDQRLGETYIILHDGNARRLRVAEVGNASLFPMDYVVRRGTVVRTAEATEDQREFALRGMCVERPGHVAVLAVNPRGSVREDERYGTVLPAPPAPAVAVLPFCAPHYTFARYPELSTVYGYEYTWTCPEAAVMTVTKYHPTYSVLSHTPELGGNALGGSDGVHGNGATLCELAVVNHITQTEQRDWFVVQRVYPSPLPATSLVVLSDNAADSLRVVPASASSLLRGTRSQRGAPGNGASRASSTAASLTTVSMDALYSAPVSTYPFTRARRVVGKSVVLHVDAPSEAGKARWAVESIVPATTTSVGTQVLMSGVEFEALYRHPAAVARGRGGSTVLVKGLRTPGVYTITHTLPDPQNPSVCPPVTLTDMLDVFHAQVLEKEVFVCGDTAALQAVPIPREMAHEFIGQWEVLSLATDESTVWTAGVNFTGIRFERGSSAETLVHGLPFGVVTMRWAVYRLLPSPGDAASVSGDVHPAGAAQQNVRGGAATPPSPPPHLQAQRPRVLVDYDTVELFVLTENLPSHRLVTLADEATIVTTSSARNWVVEDVVGALGDGAVAAAASVRLSHLTIANYSHGSLDPFTAAMSQDAAGRALFHTYYGVHPRPGSGALLLQHLPVGTAHLRYDIIPSQNLFGRMVGHTCALQGYYEVERVSAYLTATTSLDHECDGYTGQGRITLCLNTDGAGMNSDSTSTTKQTSGNRPSVRATSTRRGSGASVQANALLWQSQVRLIAPEMLEEVVKHGAREVEQLSRGRCSTPWWVAPSTQWLHPSYASASAAAGVSGGSAQLPGRCVSFAVKAGRHLSPREAAHPLFVAVPRPSLTMPSAAANQREGSGGAFGACPFHGDFISTRIIDGAPLVNRDTAWTGTAASTAAATSHSTFFGLSQLFQLGLPHTSGRREGKSSDGGAWGIRFLPVLQPSSLRRANATMRPMMGLRGVPDDVASELNISGLSSAHQRSVAPEFERTGTAATVLLRLDLTNAKHVGGYTISSTPDHERREPDAAASSTPVSVPRESLLYKCVEGTVRGSDVLQYWSETNRPDGRVDRTAQEWLDYAYAVRDAPVACDVLFSSLDHLVADSYDPSTRAPQPGSSSGSAASSGWYGRRGRRVATPSSAAASPPSSPPYVSLTEMEQQVERLRRQYRWTADGIDVTGLPADLQTALSHRRVTTTQLRAIEAARRTRQAAEEAEAAAVEQQRAHRGLENAPSQMSPMERLAAALRAYQGVAQGGEVAVLRVHLPLHEAFTVPYDVFLRTALHKDVLCGTDVDPPPPVADPTAQPTVMNPYSLVALGRVEIRDAPPALSLYPPVVKQCEVEGGLPVLTFELSGAAFAQKSYTADEVLLEEVANPALVKAGHEHHPDVGLAACVAEMRRGLKAVVEDGSQKRLYLQLNACPFFKMLTPEEYNEHQDSAELLRRLQFSRYLRVTVRRAIRADSFLSGKSAGMAMAREGSHARTSLYTSGHQAAAMQNVSSLSTTVAVTPTSTDATFIVEVRPTLARLHLRSTAQMGLPSNTAGAGSGRARHHVGMRTAPAATEGVDSGSWWSRSAGDGAGGESRTSAPTAATENVPQYAFTPTPARPLILCEADLHRYGFQLGIELIGDTWTKPVGEDGSTASTTTSKGQRAALPRQRAPPNVALINSFSVVEHHSLDSSHHLYMKGGGVYRSHFINYLFSTLLRDPAVLQEHTFVYRYNSTFASIVLPPLSAVSPLHRDGRDRGAFAEFEEGEEDMDFYAIQQQQQQQRTRSPQHRRSSVPGKMDSSTTATSAEGTLPAVRQFSKVEEILFAVPGIATECRGCLLADTTFFVAGDLTGVWSPTSAVPAAASAAATSPEAARWSAEAFTRPLVVPWDAVVNIPRQWAFEWVCPAAAHRALERVALHVTGRSDGVANTADPTATTNVGLFVVMDVVLYRVRGLAGEELPALQRPTVLLSSEPVSLTDVLRQNRAVARASDSAWSGRLGQAVPAAPLHLRVNESAASAAYTRLTDDVLRHRRHVRTTMDYHRDARDAEGRLVVNASVFLKVCAGRAACTVVSITDALLAVEAQQATSHPTSWLRRVMGLGSRPKAGASTARATSPVSMVALLHHAFITYLCHELLPLLGIVVVGHEAMGGGGAPRSDSFTEDQQRAHVAFTVMAFVFLFFSYAYAPVIWTALWVLVWTLSLYHSRRPELVFLFVASVVYSHYLL